jgi:energy-converting hydrogenase Eha subunit G
MNYGFVFKAIAVLVVIGGIFLTGFITGGSWATGMTQDSVLRRIEQCVPAQSPEDLRPCLDTSEEP